jgi:ATP synthase subunit C.
MLKICASRLFDHMNKWLAVALIALLSTLPVLNAQATTEQSYMYLGAGLAFGLAAIGAGVGMGIAGAAIASASVEKRDILVFFLVLAFVETIALYGLVALILLR